MKIGTLCTGQHIPGPRHAHRNGMACEIIEPLARRHHRVWRDGAWAPVSQASYGVRWADGTANYTAPHTLRPNDVPPGLQAILNLFKEPCSS